MRWGCRCSGYARGLKTLAEALYLLGQLELADREPAGPGRDARRTVVVVGASYARTELVVQLRALADEAARRQLIAASDIRFLLLDSAGHVMPEVGPRMGERVLRVLRERGVEVRLGTTLTRVAEDHVVLSDGTRVETRTVAWVTGVTASPLIGRLGLTLDRGRLVVDADLSVPGHPDVFAGGDAAGVPDLTKAGTVTPPTAQHATRQGHALAGNVAATLGLGRVQAYRHRDLGLVVDLGPRHAVADPLGLHPAGFREGRDPRLPPGRPPPGREPARGGRGLPHRRGHPAAAGQPRSRRPGRGVLRRRRTPLTPATHRIRGPGRPGTSVADAHRPTLPCMIPPSMNTVVAGR